MIENELKIIKYFKEKLLTSENVFMLIPEDKEFNEKYVKMIIENTYTELYSNQFRYIQSKLKNIVTISITKKEYEK